MSQSLPDLETLRAQLLQQFLTLGDFRPGTVSAAAHRCGRPTCHCARPQDPGHPQFRLLRKVRGKSVAESFVTPLAFRQAAEQVTEFHRFQQLIAELTTLNEQICRLRPTTPDGMPIIGCSSKYENLILATGHAMLGLSLGPGTGQIVAEIANGKPTAFDIQPLRLERFK